MRIRGVGRWGMACLGLSCLVLSWAQTAQAQVKLEYKYPEGKAIKHKTTSKTNQVLTLMGQQIETQSNQTVTSSSTVGKKREDSSVPVEQKVESLRVELSLPGGINVTYDSSDPNAKIDNEQLAFLEEVFKLSSQISYTVVLEKENKVKAIEGTEKLLEKADKLSPMARDAIRSRVESDKLKVSFEQEMRHLPDVLTRPGESWERTEVLDLGSGQTLTFQKKYEYVGTEKKGDKTLDKISVKTLKADLKQDPAVAAPIKLVKCELKVESSDGTILFDREEGQLVSSHGKFRVKGDDLTFSINGNEIPGTLDLTIESSVELEPGAK
jgi:hypothetical protein